MDNYLSRFLSSALFFIALLSSPLALASGSGHHHHQKTASAVGQPAEQTQATKTIHVTMTDNMKFYFQEALNIAPGDTVLFIVKNDGKIPHEFSIGNQHEHKEHQKMMRKMPNMRHEDGNTITVDPGKTKEIVWQFNGEKEVIFACNIPGHYEAGMHHRMTLIGK
ncbi:cupredoxin family protein [Zooshikella marina]|uniref:cupredoxin domain-containing protein n=1 Tax=Zooshikella ganghwensis TaxID=202772 RepID=UPI00041C3997|nr:cupredoxin family protein [Zooshikella ganghwensis]MBU2708085.1 cupredoxin family protein [Zooshikella ganghwensis]